VTGEGVTVNRKKVSREERFDGKFVLRTNTSSLCRRRKWASSTSVSGWWSHSSACLWTYLSLSQFDDTIRGHIFSSFWALLLRHELITHLEAYKEKPEWNEVIRDLEALRAILTTLAPARRLRKGVQGRQRCDPTIRPGDLMWCQDYPRASLCPARLAFLISLL